MPVSRRAAPSVLGRVRAPAKPRGPRGPTGVRTTTTGGVGGGRLAEAAAEIASAARELAAAWSVQIPPSIRVDALEHVAEISSQAGPAYPGETRARHPLYGNRRFWYGPPGAPFLGPAADARAGAAMAKYAKKIDDMARKAGFE